jgi:hypothetical protein
MEAQTFVSGLVLKEAVPPTETFFLGACDVIMQAPQHLMVSAHDMHVPELSRDD